jgi:hypothetical protein
LFSWTGVRALSGVDAAFLLWPFDPQGNLAQPLARKIGD